MHDQLNQAVGLINELIRRVRNLSLELRPQMLDDLGLLVALDWLFKRYTQQTNIRVDFRRTALDARLPSLLETAIFRIAQEALTNVARHAASGKSSCGCGWTPNGWVCKWRTRARV